VTPGENIESVGDRFDQRVAGEKPQVHLAIVDAGVRGNLGQAPSVEVNVADHGQEIMAGEIDPLATDLQVDAAKHGCLAQGVGGVLGQGKVFLPGCARLDAMCDKRIEANPGPQQKGALVAKADIDFFDPGRRQTPGAFFERHDARPGQAGQADLPGPDVGRPGGKDAQGGIATDQSGQSMVDRAIATGDEQGIVTFVDGLTSQFDDIGIGMGSYETHLPALIAQNIGSAFGEHPGGKTSGSGIIDDASFRHNGTILPETLRGAKPMTESRLLKKRYQLGRRMGSGGMSVVYKGRDLMLERTVAIKVLREDFSVDPAFRERFRQEAKAAANLSHPNIVTVHDFGIDQGHIFIVMEFVPGTTLKTLIGEKGRFDPDDAIPLIVQACAGIGYAHRAGLVHCDVKPQNMLVSPDRRLKVTDFGIARALASIQEDEISEIVWGSPQYFSPEQASGRSPSPSSDVYSLGIILYEMLTGSPPFEAENSTDLAYLHRNTTPRPPIEMAPSISESLNQIILKVLSKEPSRRYRTADQLGRVLMTFSQKSDSVEEVTMQEAPLPPEPSVAAPQQPAISTRSSQAGPDPLEIDWVTALLGLLTLLSVGGLIPFWLWVYFSINP